MFFEMISKKETIWREILFQTLEKDLIDIMSLIMNDLINWDKYKNIFLDSD